jgi:hypothetical protein
LPHGLRIRGAGGQAGELLACALVGGADGPAFSSLSGHVEVEQQIARGQQGQERPRARGFQHLERLGPPPLPPQVDQVTMMPWKPR